MLSHQKHKLELSITPEDKLAGQESKEASSFEEEFDLLISCPLTTEEFKNLVITPCGHAFEEEEIKNWINKGVVNEQGQYVKACPECNTEICTPQLHKDFRLTGLLKFIKERMQNFKDLMGAEDKATKIKELESLLEAARKEKIQQAKKHEQELTEKEMVSDHLEVGLNKKIDGLYCKLKEEKEKITDKDQAIAALQAVFLDKDQTILNLEEQLITATEKFKQTEKYEQQLKAMQTEMNSLRDKLTKIGQILQMDKPVIERKEDQASALSAASSRLFTLPEKKEINQSTESPTIPLKTRLEQTAKLMEALDEDNLGKAEIALRNGADPNYFFNKVSLISKLTQHNKFNSVELLIKYKANVNAISQTTADTALHWAAYKGNSEIVDLLLRNGADPTILNANRKTPLDEMGKHDMVIAGLLETAMKEITEKRKEETEINEQERLLAQYSKHR